MLCSRYITFRKKQKLRKFPSEHLHNNKNNVNPGLEEQQKIF